MPVVESAQSIGTAFIGFNLQDEFNILSTGFIPPDTMRRDRSEPFCGND